MINRTRLSVLSLVLIFALSLGAVAVSAQEPGQGGLIVWGNQRGSANIGSLIDLRCSGVDCRDVTARLYPSLIGLDPSTQAFEPYDGMQTNLVANALANGWDVSEDGLVYTVYLRDDMVWNDGTPITAQDVMFSWGVIQNDGLTELSSSFLPAKTNIADVEYVDDYTVKFYMNSAQCTAINRIALVAPHPGHAFGWTMDATDFDWTTVATSTLNREPTVTAGVFQWVRSEPGTAIYLEANPSYADPVNGIGVLPSGMVYVDVPDYNVMAERLLANLPGDVNYIHEPNNSIVPTLRDGGANLFEAPGSVWHYVAVNMADPTNPQNGFDEDGNFIDQGFHPILGDVRVRQALQYAVNIDEVIASAQNGNASPMVAGTIPSAFTLHPTLERRPYDLDAARALLDEAGWVSTGDPLVDGGDGLRTCQGCLHAEEGTEMFLDIMAPDQPRTNAAVILQADFAKLGIDVEVRTLDFNTMYDNNMGAQTFDLAVAGWRGGVPFNPDQRSFFGAEADIFGEQYGFNFGSYQSERFEELNELVNTVPGCATEDIQAVAWQIQELMWEEQPYLWLYAVNSAYAVNSLVDGFDPFPAAGAWNIDAWTVRQ